MGRQLALFFVPSHFSKKKEKKKETHVREQVYEIRGSFRFHFSSPNENVLLPLNPDYEISTCMHVCTGGAPASCAG
jgi:hypothetical protein